MQLRIWIIRWTWTKTKCAWIKIKYNRCRKTEDWQKLKNNYYFSIPSTKTIQLVHLHNRTQWLAKRKPFIQNRLVYFLQKHHDSTYKVSITISNVPFLTVKSLPFIKCQLQKCVNKTPNNQLTPNPTDTHTPQALFRIYIQYMYTHCTNLYFRSFSSRNQL